MAELVKRRRLVNPGKKRRNLSPLQKLFFGTKRQRAAVKANKGKKRRRNVAMGYRGSKRVAKSWTQGITSRPVRRRKRNISSIVTVSPAKRNPGRRKYKKRNSRKVIVVNKGRKRMATKRRVVRRRTYRRKRNYGTQKGRSWSYYAPRPSGIKRKKKGNPGRVRRRRVSRGVSRHHRRRRNPGFLSMGGGGTMTSVAGVVGGLALTKVLCGFVPPQFTAGVLGYLATGVIAVAQGKLAGKVFKSPTLGHNMMVGGLAYLAAKVLNDFLPSVGGYTGISGMGLIGGGSFYNPQVNQNGSMGSFVLPAATMGAIAANMPATATTGVRGLRRTGRLM